MCFDVNAAFEAGQIKRLLLVSYFAVFFYGLASLREANRFETRISRKVAKFAQVRSGRPADSSVMS